MSNRGVGVPLSLSPVGSPSAGDLHFLNGTKGQVVLIGFHKYFSEMRELETLMWNKSRKFEKCPSKLLHITDCETLMYLAEMCLGGLS